MNPLLRVGLQTEHVELREYLRRHGLTVADLARSGPISYDSLQAVLCGRRRLTHDFAQRVDAALRAAIEADAAA